MTEYHWKDMAQCSGAVPKALSTRLFEVCYNPVSKASHRLLPLCDQHLEDILGDILAPSLDRIEELEADTADAYGRGLQAGLAHRAEEAEKEREERQRSRDLRSVVYFLRCDGFVKIGTTANIENRVASIKKTGGVLMPDGLNYKTATLVKKIHGSTQEEKSLHAKFAHLRHTGEWFAESPELTEHIESLDDYEIPEYKPQFKRARRNSDPRKEAIRVAMARITRAA